MKLKFIAVLAGWTLSAASQAAILGTTNAGGSDLLLNVWEQVAPGGQPDQSFTLNLNETLSQFVAQSGSTATLATLLSTDATWTSFLASSDTADAGVLRWSVIASGNKTVGKGPSILGTVTAGTDPTTAGRSGFLIGNDLLEANAALSGMIGGLDKNLDEQVAARLSNGYYQAYDMQDFNSSGFDNGNAIGVTANVETGTSDLGTRPATMTQLPGTMNFSQVGGNYVLNYTVAAAPEAPGWLAMLAGLAALTLIGRRRKSA